ncbi:MAG: TraR/DksA C4-type zinc finger protein [Candidatus Dormibacteria bacterium]
MDSEPARDRLRAEQARLQEVRAAADRLVSAANEAETGELSSIDQHPAEQATETLEREIDQGVLQRVDAELAEVEAALERLDAGAYGVCEICGQAIAEGRLEAMPATRYCVEDQARVDRNPLLARQA